MIVDRCMKEKNQGRRVKTNQGRRVKTNQGRRVKTHQGRRVKINQLWAGLKTKQRDRKESRYRYRNSLVFRLIKFVKKLFA